MIKPLGISASRLLLEHNYVGHLGYISRQSPFVVPITYFYDKEGNSLIGYSGEGHKIVSMRANHWVSLEVEEIESVRNWKSVLVQGKYEEIKGGDAKYYLHRFVEGIKKLIEKKEDQSLASLKEFTAKIREESISVIYRIKITDITGKYRNE